MRCVILSLALTIPAALHARHANAFQLKWNELGLLATGRTATARLTDGKKVKGKVLAVEPDGLRMEGKPLVPRAAITDLDVGKSTKRWRIVGTSIGVGIGAPIAGVAHAYLTNEAGKSDARLSLLVAIPAALGYLAGRSADRKILHIHILPGE